MYIETRARPDLSVATSMLTLHTNGPKMSQKFMAKRFLSALHATKKKLVVLRPRKVDHLTSYVNEG